MPPLEASDQELLSRAFDFALRAHAEQTRRGNDVPYVSHLLQVAGLIFEHGGGVEQAVAGLLHDTVEDCEDVEIEDVEREFGAKVAGIVASCTDTLPGDTPKKKTEWELRKTRYLEHLATCDVETRLVAACDKCHNLRNILTDLKVEGLETLERFNANPDQLLWYHEQVLRVTTTDLPEGLVHEMESMVGELRRVLFD